MMLPMLPIIAEILVAVFLKQKYISRYQTEIWLANQLIERVTFNVCFGMILLSFTGHEFSERKKSNRKIICT